MQPDEPNQEEQLQQLPEDGQTPFQPAVPEPGASSDLPTDHPATDTGIDPTELYNEGVSGAAEVEDKSADSAVVDVDVVKSEGDESDPFIDQAL